MGILNEQFSENKLSLSKLEEILNNLLTKAEIISKNRQILEEIGLLKEYSLIVLGNSSNEIVYYSKSHRIVEKIIFISELRAIFLEWNRFLFDITEEDLNSMQALNKKVNSFKKRVLDKNFFRNNIKNYLFKDKSLNKLLNYGIPNNIRPFLWEIVISEKYNNKTLYNYEQELKEYQIYLSKKETCPQIEKDLNRTFLNTLEQTPKNLQCLRNILNCIHRYNQSGYCQGMNYIVGYLLKLTNFNEVKTFYIFKNILYDIKGYFEEGFPLLKKNTILFNKYFKELNPKLYYHFQKYEIINEFWVSKWLQTLFTLSFPFEELNCIWDVLLIRGFDFIIYICLSIIDFLEKDILELKESSNIISYLEKSLNSQQNELIPGNKFFYDNIKEYIVRLCDVLEKAYFLEKKIMGEKQRHYYEGRRSCNNLNNFQFNTLKDESINIEKNNLSFQKNSEKIKAKPTIQSAAKPQISNFDLNNNNMEIKKIAPYSTKNLGIYNFGLTNEYNNNTYPQSNNIYKNINSSNNNITGPYQSFFGNNNLQKNNFIPYYH